MGEEVYIVAIVFGSVVTIVTLSIIGGIVKTWVKNRNNPSIVNDENFLEALREFKEKTDRRLSKLESRPPNENRRAGKKVEPPAERSINIETDEHPQESTSGQSLKNMLKE